MLIMSFGNTEAEGKFSTEEAFELGRLAFLYGMSRIPAHDKDLIQELANMPGDKPVGSGLPYYKAWIDGWDYEKVVSFQEKSLKQMIKLEEDRKIMNEEYKERLQRANT